MRLVLASLILASAPLFAADPSLAEQYDNLGRMIVGPFASAPFPHPARTEGHTYKGERFSAAEHYSDSTVAVFVPRGFRPGKQVDCVVYFHGWRSTVARSLAIFRLAEQFAASGRNAVLIFPEGPRDAPDSFGGKLEDEGGFTRFMDEVAGTLRREPDFATAGFSFGRIILAGHSGAYRVMGGILARGGMSDRIAEVWLFDALYGQTEVFTAWADRSHGRLLNIYTDGGGTKEETEKLIARLAARGTPLVRVEETRLEPATLKAGGYVFIHTELGHNDVVAGRNQFQLFLRTSVLAER